MLQKLNERIQGLVAWLVISLIAITFTLFGIDYYIQSNRSSDVKAVVNDKVISEQSFEANYRRVRNQRDVTTLTVESEKRLRQEVLESMISSAIEVQGAKKYGFQVSGEQANAAIVGIPQFQEAGHFSTERFQQALSGALYTPETFQNEVKQGMLLNQQRFAFMGSAFALPNEMTHFVKLYLQTRDYDYLVIPTHLFNKDVHITEEDIKSYYEKHANSFQTPEKVKIDYVRLSLPAIRANLKISDDEVKKYFDENQNNYLQPAKWQVAHILFAAPENATPETLEKVKKKAADAYDALQANPDLFNQWVKTLSDDKLSAVKEGVLPWIVAGQTEFDKHLVELTKPKQISQPINTSKGYEIFKLIDYVPASVKPFSEVKAAIKEQLLTEMAQTHYTAQLEKLSELSYQTPNSLDPVAQELHTSIQQSGFFSKDTGEDELTKNKSVIRAAFSNDVLKLGNNSEPVQVDSDSVIVLRINKHLPATQKGIDEVKKDITTTLTRERTALKAKELGSTLTQTNETLPATMAKYNLKWQPVKAAGRDTDKVNPMINALAYSVTGVGNYEGRTLTNGDFALVQLKKVNIGNYNALDAEQKLSLAQQIESSNGLMDYDLYVAALRAQAKIEKH